jgi:hypothetical protein
MTTTTRTKSNRRRWAFRLLAICIGLAPIVAIETALRIAGIPETLAADDPLVDLHQIKPLFVMTDDGQRWEIPASRFNFFRPASFAATKESDEFRIFVLGGSTVQGRPFATETAFSTWLEIGLQTVAPATDWQVINCGGISYASYRLAPILDEVITHQPDLIILYTGHNEFLEDRTYGQLKTIPRGIAQVVEWGNRLHLTRWISAKIKTNEGAGAESGNGNAAVGVSTADNKWIANAEVRARLDRAGGLDDYHRQPQWRASVIDHFARTLRRMIDRCESAEVPLILCVPTSNLVDCPPFKIENSPYLSPEQLPLIKSQWAIASQPEESEAARIAACRRILEIDPLHAGAAFVLGKLLLQGADRSEAIGWLVKARDADVCPLRAPTEIENAVREIGDANGVPVIDCPARFTATSRDGLLDATSFVDHVHPTIEMHQKISRWLIEAMGRLDLLTGIDTESRSADAAIRQAFARHWATLDEAYFARGRQRLEGLRLWAAGRAGELSVD